MKKVLLTPLDWGLGHASRCVPIVRELLGLGCEVVIAGSGNSLRLLQKEFPFLQSLELPGYDPVYPETGSFFWKMMAQMPRFGKTIKAEQRIVEDAVRALRIDAIISDNRYGCRSDLAYSILVTHQLNIIPPRNYSWLAPAINAYHRRLIDRFNLCWVPDVEGSRSLAGRLSSHRLKDLKCPVEYIGHLSRFRPSTAKLDYEISCILSGPEPQRAMFEAILKGQLERSGIRHLIVSGVETTTTNERGTDKALVAGDELQTILTGSRYVVARSGYSTVMDLAATGSRAILVPTPGQPEQEYLADRLKSLGICYTQAQSEIDLELALKQSGNYKGFSVPGIFESRIKKAVEEMLERI
jgi:UDP:flavonoid glycosyltransferase YjiC (YdhE family)